MLTLDIGAIVLEAQIQERLILTSEAIRKEGTFEGSETPLRRVQFSIDSPVIESAQITSLLGIDPDMTVAVGQVRPGSVLRRPASRNTWQIVESGDDSADVDEMLRRMCGRLGPVREEIRSLRNAGCEVLVSVIQYLSAADRAGPGFSLDSATLEFISFVGAELDVDQYVIE